MQNASKINCFIFSSAFVFVLNSDGWCCLFLQMAFVYFEECIVGIEYAMMLKCDAPKIVSWIAKLIR